MIKKIFFVLFILINISVFGQKRNNVQIAGLAIDVFSIPNREINPFFNNFRYVVAYQRLVGNRLLLGVNYSHVYGHKEEPVSYDYGAYSPVKIPNKTFYSAKYNTRGFGLGYESRYYFSDFDEDGANSSYIGFNYQHTRITEFLTDALYYQNSSPSTEKFDDNVNSINRFGITYGISGTLLLNSEFSVGVYYNIVNKNQEWKSPINFLDYSFNLTWLIGIPF